MSYRLTFVLAIIALVLGGYIALRPPPPEEPPEEQIWFYLVDDTKIDRLDADYFGEQLTFVRDENRKWHLGDTDGPTVSDDFTGTPFLAAGAQSPRIISQDPNPDLEKYGLVNPKLSLRIYLEDGKSYRVFLGDLTPDRINNYAQFEGFPDIYLVDRTWGEHMAQLITDPPIGTPSPDTGGSPADAGL
jgi:hypothetical protein